MSIQKSSGETGSSPLSGVQKTIFIILLLFSIHFWDLKFFPKMFNIQNLLVWVACIGSFFMILDKKNMRFRGAILFFIFGLLMNVLAAYINLGQSPKVTILSFGYYYFIMLYFLLHYLELDRKFLENTILAFGSIYSFIFLAQYAVYPYQLFNRETSTAIEELQLEILGHGFLMLSYFLLLNRYLTTRRLINIFFALVFFLVLLKSGFRTLVAGAAVGTMIMVLRTLKLRARDIAVVIVISSLFVGLLQFKGISQSIDKMINKTSTDLKMGKRYVRLVEMEFFFKRYPRNLSYYIIGGGKVSGSNLYNYDPDIMGLNYHIVWVDIGLLGFYIVIGGLATIGLLWYSLKAIFIKLPKESYYLSFYFLYLFIVSFTNEEIYRNGIFSVQAIALYLIDISIEESKKVANKLNNRNEILLNN